MKKKGSINKKTIKIYNKIKEIIKKLKNDATTNNIVKEYMILENKNPNDYSERMIFLGKISYHLKRLEKRGILKSKKVKNSIIYSITNK